MNGTFTSLWGVALAASLLVILAGLCAFATPDDAFISFRYSQNLAAGEGLVFNHGERVEGFSNLLWVLLMSVFEKLHLNTVVWAKGIGLASALLALYFTAEIGRKHMNLSPGIVTLGLLYIATSAGVVFYAVSGMETAFFMLQVVLLGYFLLERRPVAAGLVCGTLMLTRPEGVLYSIPLIVSLWIYGSTPRRFIRALMMPGAVLLLLVLWRWSYYSSLLPNTYYSKIIFSGPVANDLLLHTKGLVMYTVKQLRGGSAILVLAAFGALYSGRRQLLPLVVTVLAAVAFVWFSAGDWMSFARFYVPVIPFIALFWLAGADSVRRSVASHGARQAGLVALMILPLVLSAAGSAASIRDLQLNRDVNPAIHCLTHLRVAAFLNQQARPSDVVAVNEPGAVAYYTGLRVVDLSGVTDAEVARFERNDDMEACAAYVMSARPRFVLLNGRQRPWDDEPHPLHRAIYDGMMADGSYAKERSFELSYYKELLLFCRTKDAPSGESNEGESG